MKKSSNLSLAILVLLGLFFIAGCKKKDDDIIEHGTMDNLKWKITKDYDLIISGKGEMPDFYVVAPWHVGSHVIKTILIEEGITNIGTYAFSFHWDLVAITIPNSVTSIGKYAFHSCTSLVDITISNGVNNIHEKAFYGCSNLAAINVAAGNLNFDSDNGVLLNAAKDTLIRCPVAKQGDYVIPNSVTYIGYGAFDRCLYLTDITIPNSVTHIDSLAFSYCKNLTHVTIPENVTRLEYQAFYGCEKLSSIIISKGITSIGDNVFWASSLLRTFFIHATMPPEFGIDNFIYTSFDTPYYILYVPAESVDLYKNSSWGFYMEVLAL